MQARQGAAIKRGSVALLIRRGRPSSKEGKNRLRLFSPQKLQTELNLARRSSIGSAGDHTRAPIIISPVIDETQAWQSEVRVVCDVEELCTELNPELLGDPWNCGVLQQRKVQCDSIRAGDCVAAQVSKKSK